MTRDRGAQVLFAGTVPAGLDGIQAVERKLKVTTRYGGRYLQSIDGISGSLSDQRDWFFFVNGIEGDRSATEVTLHPGDVLWWDYRRWSGGAMSVPVVAGAYPEPFLHGFPGRTSVVGTDRALAARIAAAGARGRERRGDAAQPDRDRRQGLRRRPCGSGDSGTGRCSSSARLPRGGSRAIRTR